MLNKLSFLSQRQKYKEKYDGVFLPCRPYRNIMNIKTKRISNIILENGSSIPILTKQVQHIYDIKNFINPIKPKELYENWAILPYVSEQVYRNHYEYNNKDSRIKAVTNIDYENDFYKQLRYEVSNYIHNGMGKADFKIKVINKLKEFDEYDSIRSEDATDSDSDSTSKESSKKVGYFEDEAVDYKNIIQIILNSPKRILSEKFKVVTTILSYIFDQISRSISNKQLELDKYMAKTFFICSSEPMYWYQENTKIRMWIII